MKQKKKIQIQFGLTDAFKTNPDSGSRGEMCRSKSQKSKFSFEVLDAKFVGTCKVHNRKYLNQDLKLYIGIKLIKLMTAQARRH